MNWDAIGAIGEILGALAVVLSLGYLAIQVKQNTHSMKVAAKLEIDKQFTLYTDLLLNNPAMFELQIKGAARHELNERDAERFSLLMTRLTWNFSSMHYQYKTQGLSSDDWYESKRLIKWITSSEGYRAWWNKNNVNFSTDFRNYLNQSFNI